MEKLIAGFPNDIKTSVSHNQHLSDFELKPFSRVLITGLGGSGIGGTIVSELLADSCNFPIVVNKNYRVPAWVNEETLVVACSYSGNTEETLAATEQAKSQGAQLAAVTSGGELLKIAQSEKMPLVQLPSGYPPRAAFGHGLVCLTALLAACGVTAWKPEMFLGAVDLLNERMPQIKAKAEQWAKTLKDRVPVIYAAEGLGGVAVRWRQQINENGKMLCWHHILPEMNHNELVGWAGGDNRFAAIILTSPDDHPRTALRMELSKEIISKHTDTVLEAEAAGSNRIERMYHLIALGDWLSYYLSIERGVDPVEVDVITHLKSELAKH